MKKSGIILGIFFVIAALVICIFAFRIGGKSNNNSENIQNNNQETVQNQEQVSQSQEPVQQELPQQTEQQPVQQQPIQQQPVQEQVPVQQQVPTQNVGQTTVIEKVVTKEISGVQTISESSLGVPIDEKEVIVVISNKRVLLIDEDTDSTEPKMLSYCFDVLTPENDKLTLFMTQSSYTQFNVNDKLKVKYVVYKNDRDIEFPLVLNVSTVE